VNLFGWLFALIESIEHIEGNTNTILKEMKTMAGELELLQQEVEETKAAADAAVAKIVELSAFIKANAYDPQALLDMAAKLDADQAALNAAVADNPTP
jgi:hypothetical protein